MTAPYPASALEPDLTGPLILALPKGRSWPRPARCWLAPA